MATAVQAEEDDFGITEESYNAFLKKTHTISNSQLRDDSQSLWEVLLSTGEDFAKTQNGKAINEQMRKYLGES
ncbi:MAG: hypothetical protein LBN42_02355 [Oscillospiraceae bacterium]|jgi:hypothetical protein|nr:hypothetical protein [Oscillospiraceae bacterium]